MTIEFTRVAPVLPVRDVTAALEHYRRLGFECAAYGERDECPRYGFVGWGCVELHLAQVVDLDPRASRSACYFYVNDADAVHAYWRAAAVPGTLQAPVDTAFGLREFSYVDPDGNELRVGSPARPTLPPPGG